MPRYFEPLIHRWATVVEFAKEVGCPVNNAREWVRIDSIPAAWFSAVSRAAAAKGFLEITPESLSARAEMRRLTLEGRRSTTEAGKRQQSAAA